MYLLSKYSFKTVRKKSCMLPLWEKNKRRKHNLFMKIPRPEKQIYNPADLYLNAGLFHYSKVFIVTEDDGTNIFTGLLATLKMVLFVRGYQITTKTKVNVHVEFYPPCSQTLSKLLGAFTSSNVTRLNSNRDERKARRLSSSPSAPGIKTLCV